VKMCAALEVKDGIQSESSVIGQLRQHSSAAMGSSYGPYQKALELMHAVVCAQIVANYYNFTLFKHYLNDAV